MKRLAILLLVILLPACATVPFSERPGRLFRDALFTAPTERISAADVFAVSDAMRHYLRVEIAEQLRVKGSQQGLIDALYNKSQLKVDYDSAQTRNAAETFRGRAGNCLSLVIMTAALAKELGLPVQYQGVFVDESWSRAGGLYFSAGHVNLTVGKRFHDIKTRVDDNVMITIDFNPPQENRSHPLQVLAGEAGGGDLASGATEEAAEATKIAPTTLINAQAMNPFAVSRKNTSWVWA